VRQVLILVIVLLLGQSGVLYAEPPNGYPFIQFDDGLAQAKASNKPVFLYFGRQGCGWCDKTNREAFSDTMVRELYTSHYVLVYVDSESGKRLTLPSGERITETELGSRLGVHATPVFVFMEPDGKAVARTVGVQTVQDLKDYDRYIYGKHYSRQTFSQFKAAEK
jgi:thioredoxin-related protein